MALNFSVLMSIYYKENPDYFNSCMNSIVIQTSPPTEIVLVKDGPLPEKLDKAILKWKEKLGDMLKLVPLEKNVGLGRALQIGLLNCKHEIIARVDTDDICRKDRFEKQIKFLENNPKIDIVGSWIGEFERDINNIICIRKVPLTHDKIKKYARFRSPLNHPSVVFRKQAVLESGGYLPFQGLEDYYLWVRMLKSGKRFANINEPLVLFRLDKNTFARRGGIKYFLNELKLQKYFLDIDFINFPIFIYNLIVRIFVRLIPWKIRKCFYKFFLRKKVNI